MVIGINKAIKIVTLIFFLYLIWFKEAFITINLILYGCVILLICLTVYGLYKSGDYKHIKIDSMTKNYFYFFIYALGSGAIVVVNTNSFFSNIIRYGMFSVLCASWIYISKKENNIKWLLNIFIICAILCSFQTLLFGKPFMGSYVITMNMQNNPNKLALTMLFGVMALLYDFDNFKKKLIINSILILSFLYVSMITGSRKCFFSIIIVLIFWFINYFKYYSNNRLLKKNKLILLFIIFIPFIFFIKYCYKNTAVSIRIDTFGTEKSGTSARVELYKEAYNIWLIFPISGVGFSQFVEYNHFNNFGKKYYSHSTYAELLSCTGIVGIVLFFFIIFKRVLSCLYTILFNKYINEQINNRLKMITLYFFIEITMAAVQILFYEIDHMIFLSILFVESDRNLYLANLVKNKGLFSNV